MCAAANVLVSVSRARRVFAGAIKLVVESLEARRLFSAGDLDPSFAGGIVLHDLFGHDDLSYSLTIQNDGKILAAGRADTDGPSGTDFAIARFNADGSIDSTFGTGGVVLTDMGSIADNIRSIAVQNDGKIVVAGETFTDSTSTDFALARYLANGSLDATFGTGGKVVTDFSGDIDQLNAMSLMPDGRIVVTGWTYAGGLPQFMAARYTATGAPDGSFGSGGHAVATFASGYSQAQCMAMLGDGSFIAAGGSYDFSTGGRDFAAVHFFANGSVDPAFGSGGFATIDLGGDSEFASAALVQNNGRIILAGRYHNSSDSRDDFAVARLLPNGTLDTSFGNSGFSLTDFGGNYDDATSAALQSDGKIVVAGQATIGFQSMMGVARYNSDGTPDTSFAGGFVAVPAASQADTNAVAIDSNGNIVVGGSALADSGGYDFAVARLIGHSNVAPTANAGGTYTVASGGSVSLDGSGSSDSDGQIVSYAWDFNYDGSSFDSDASGAHPTFSAAGLTGPMTRTIALRVTDDSGDSSIITTLVTISAPPPPAPTPDPTPDPKPDPKPDPTPTPGGVVVKDDPANPGKKILVFTGTAKGDRVSFRKVKNGKIEVKLGCKKLGQFASISQIVASGGDGNDVIDASGVNVPVVLMGGKGNDHLHGGKFNDLLIGGDGNDHLFGGDGNDVIVGGAGKDDLHSRLGNDLMVGGSLKFESNLDAMRSVLAEWSRTDLALAKRIDHLQHGGGLNGANLLSGENVIDDRVRDAMHGTPGADWMIDGAGDKIDKLKMPKSKK